jgi:hypothetical protein
MLVNYREGAQLVTSQVSLISTGWIVSQLEDPVFLDFVSVMRYRSAWNGIVLAVLVCYLKGRRNNFVVIYLTMLSVTDRLCGLVVRVPAC